MLGSWMYGFGAVGVSGIEVFVVRVRVSVLGGLRVQGRGSGVSFNIHTSRSGPEPAGGGKSAAETIAAVPDPDQKIRSCIRRKRQSRLRLTHLKPNKKAYATSPKPCQLRVR